MFREMRRKTQSLSHAMCEEILRRATAGVLAVAGDDGYPYAVPLSFAYEDGRILFHGALTGHKLDAIAREDKVSFCVIDGDQVVPEEFTTYFRSVIAFGRARVLSSEPEKRRALKILADKYSPGLAEARDRVIAEQATRTAVVEIVVEYLSGKEAIELVRMR